MATAKGSRVRVLVVDDEPLARSNLLVLLRKDPDIEWVRECGGGAAAIEEIAGSRPDLVFLDVQMPEIGGFEVLTRLQERMPGGQSLPVIVFVTAHEEHALGAFDAGAIDYLLKPFDNMRFELALTRAKQRLQPPAVDSPKPLAVKLAGRVSYIEQAQIDWVEAADYYVCLHVGPKSHLLRLSMLEITNRLDTAMFCRVHRGAIVNLQRVRALELNESESHVVLSSGVRLPLSRRYRKDLQARMERAL
jgi:two-component system, LytTR family, response regulator